MSSQETLVAADGHGKIERDCGHCGELIISLIKTFPHLPPILSIELPRSHENSIHGWAHAELSSTSSFEVLSIWPASQHQRQFSDPRQWVQAVVGGERAAGDLRKEIFWGGRLLCWYENMVSDEFLDKEVHNVMAPLMDDGATCVTPMTAVKRRKDSTRNPGPRRSPCLLILLGDLLSLLWPSTHIVIGMLTCKTLQAALVKAPLVKLMTCRTIYHIPEAAKWLQRFTGKVELSCESRPIETPELCSDVFQLITEATRLDTWRHNIRRICLDANGIGNQGAGAMAAALSQCVGLVELSLRENGLGDVGGEQLATGLRSALTHLDLANNSIDDHGVCCIADALHAQNVVLRYLNLSENTFGAAGAKCLSQKLCTHRLEVLSMGLKDTFSHDDGINSKFATHLGTGLLAECTAIKNLSIPGRFIGHQGAQSLAAGLMRCTMLEHLDLSENNIGVVGAEHITLALAGMTALRALDLSMNFIGQGGARHLQGVLRRNTRLTKLDLQFNEIGEQGAEYIAAGLGECCCLSELSIYNNNIADAGLRALCSSFGMSSLYRLNVNGNNISDEGLGVLAEALGKHRSVKFLAVSSNNFTPKSRGVMRLRAALASCYIIA